MGALLLLPCRFLARPETIRGLSSFMVVWIDIVIFVTQIFSQELAPGTALYACSIALSALFLSRPLVRLCCISSMVLFSAECVILSVQLVQPVEATPGPGRVPGGDPCGVYSSGSVREELQLLSHGDPHSKGRLRPPPLGAGRETKAEPAGPRPPAAASGVDRPGVSPGLSGGRKSGRPV